MSECTLPADARRDGDSSGDIDPCTDDGLRNALDVIWRAGSWDLPVAHALLAEIRRRAARNASHVASTTGVALERGLVDDVLLAAWMILRRHGEKVLAAVRPWAYLMSSAQKRVLDEVRAQQLLTATASIRGRTRELLPRSVRPVGSTSIDLATALRHEPSGAGVDSATDWRIVRQVGRHELPPLLADRAEEEDPAAAGEREQWFTAFINLLVRHGADRDVTVAAVDRLADLFAVSYVGWWEWAARRDPILADLGLSPDQCGALVALLAGSRRNRHNGRKDSLLAAVRTASETSRPVELSPLQRRRIAVYTGRPVAAPATDLPAAVTGQRDGRALATTGV
ncbi:MAG TPA: hypothetical protein VFR23_11760 [Jiangellaceae bacterium]|nr:hypothetical protein [Jiangellaceae bacterium]